MCERCVVSAARSVVRVGGRARGMVWSVVQSGSWSWCVSEARCVVWHAKNLCVWIQNASVCAFKTSPCVSVTRPHAVSKENSHARGTRLSTARTRRRSRNPTMPTDNRIQSRSLNQNLFVNLREEQQEAEALMQCQCASLRSQFRIALTN